MNKITKIFAFTCAIFVAATVVVSAEGPTPREDTQENKCETIAPKTNSFAWSKDPNVICPDDFYLRGELLLFMAQEEGLDYALTNTENTPGNANGATFPLRGGTLHGFSTGSHDWRWNFGARVNMGLFLNHDAWNLDVTWTRLYIKEDDNASASNSAAIVGLFLPASSPLLGGNQLASARWKTKFATVDFSFGKPHHISPQFILHPFAGFRGAWIDQDFVARYSGIFMRTPTGVVTSMGTKMTGKNNMWGMGLRAGLTSEWFIGAGFNFFGNIAGSLLYGKHDVSQELPLFVNDAGVQTDHSYCIDQDFYDVMPNLELQFGLQWGKHLSDDSFRFSFRMAYEFHQWWHQNYFKRFMGDGTAIARNSFVATIKENTRGDLTFNGLSFGVLLDF